MLSRPLLLVAAFSCLAILLLLLPGLPPGHSVAFNYGWSAQYPGALSWTNPLPRNLPGLWAGFGGHDFFFYAPLPYWLVAAVVDPLCPGCATPTEFVLGASLFLVASGLTMYAFLRSFFAAGSAAVGAVVYVLLPYHLLVDWFVRQAAGEFAAYAFLPLVALGMDRLRRGMPGGWILSLGVAGTALSHLPTTLLAGHVFAVLALVLVALQPGGAAARLGLLLRLSGYGLLGLALSACYWLPAVSLLDAVSPAILFDPYFEPWRWLLLREEPAPNPGFPLLILASFVACLPFLLGAVGTARGALAAFILVPAVVSVFLNIAPSEPIWRGWIIAKVQFPWRLMIFVDLAAATGAAALAARAVNLRGRMVLAAVLTPLVLVTLFLAPNIRSSGPVETLQSTYRDWYGGMEYLSPEMTKVLRTRLGRSELSHFDQETVSDTLGAMAAEFQAAQPPVKVLDRQPRRLVVQPPPGADVLSLPIQYWSPWQAVADDGSPLATRANDRFGTLDILAPPGGFGSGPVTVALPFQPSERAGAAVSLLGLLLLLALSWWPRLRRT